MNNLIIKEKIDKISLFKIFSQLFKKGKSYEKNGFMKKNI